MVNKNQRISSSLLRGNTIQIEFLYGGFSIPSRLLNSITSPYSQLLYHLDEGFGFMSFSLLCQTHYNIEFRLNARYRVNRIVAFFFCTLCVVLRFDSLFKLNQKSCFLKDGGVRLKRILRLDLGRRRVDERISGNSNISLGVLGPCQTLLEV